MQSSIFVSLYSITLTCLKQIETLSSKSKRKQYAKFMALSYCQIPTVYLGVVSFLYSD